MKKYLWIGAISFLAGILVTGYILLSPDRPAAVPSPEKPGPALNHHLLAAEKPLPAPETVLNQDFVRIVEKVGPAVVRVVAERVEQMPTFGFEEDWPFQDFWDRFFGTPPRSRDRQREYRSQAEGSGFFISADGYILTNNHIVEKAVKVRISTIEGKEYEAKPIGRDAATDLALLKVEGKNFPYAVLGDSSAIKVGEWVLAIGNPFGMEHSVTAGIISAKGRQLPGGNTPTYEDFIQTDAAINRGNSGGPLINLKGEVIGINSNILTPSGSNIGIGFAIPSDLAKKVVAQLKEKGRVVRGRLGIRGRDITDSIKKQFNLTVNKGVIISQVEPEGPAEKAGLKKYDVIVEINGQPVASWNDLRFKVADLQPGDLVTIKIIRDGKEMTVKARVDELEPVAAPSQKESLDKDVGLSLTTITPALARRYGLSTTEGLLVTEVKQYSEAARAGLQAGDIILEANRVKVNSVKEFQDILKKTESGEEIILLVRRESDGEKIDFIVTLRLP
ncbi:MAG: Do family serine endopeptidase [Candidatus Saccharicenans sp.]|nr:Do family serine endopeptidase [Candidatus Saccharicenans sp.]